MADDEQDMTPATTEETHDDKLRICSFESRKRDEMRSLIERNGGIATVAPSMQEIPIGENPQALDFAGRLIAGEVDVVVFMTGVGAKTLLAAVETRFPREEFLEALRKVCLIVRGPKPAAVLRGWGVSIAHQAAEPNTWRQILTILDENLALEGKVVAVQEYGLANEEFYTALQDRGATVLPVSVYRWALPEDTGPLIGAIQQTIAGEFDVLMITSAQQLHNVLEVADTEGVKEAWRAAASECVIASIGPTASEHLRAAGLPVDLEPAHPKMGHLVRETVAAAVEILKRKHD